MFVPGTGVVQSRFTMPLTAGRARPCGTPTSRPRSSPCSFELAPILTLLTRAGSLHCTERYAIVARPPSELSLRAAPIRGRPTERAQRRYCSRRSTLAKADQGLRARRSSSGIFCESSKSTARPSGVDLTFATHLAASSSSECQIQNSTTNLYLLVVL